MPTILSIDFDNATHTRLQDAYRGLFTVVSARSAAEGIELCEQCHPDIAILNITTSDREELRVFDRLHEIDSHLPVIVTADEANADAAIDAIARGAFEFLSKPLDLETLGPIIKQAVRIRRITKVPVSVAVRGQHNSDGDSLIGNSSEMMEVFKQIGKVANQDVTVLLRGESGTGKELVARAVFHHGNRSHKRFMAVNCAALPETLLESELFGHEKGAFTGAATRRLGKFEVCDGGTLFLDEIGDMSPLVQGKVLRALQDQQFERVGGNETISTDVRLIAATNRPLEQMVEAGTFREDLYYRLKEITITLPPLRERGDDLRLLIEHFLSRHAIALQKDDLEGIAEESLQLLLNYDWPGNVRELENVIKQSVINATGSVIIPEFLPDEVCGIDPNSVPAGLRREQMVEDLEPLAESSGDVARTDVELDLVGFIESRLEFESENIYAEAIEELERYLFKRVLEATGGNQSRAAKLLGITRGKVRARIQSFNISLDTNVVLEQDAV